MELLSYKIKDPGSRRWRDKSIAEINAKFADYARKRSQKVQHSTDAANALVVNSGESRQDIQRTNGPFANNSHFPSAPTITVMNWPHGNQNMNYDGAADFDFADTTQPM